ncbi:MAG: LuxR C-terminal-related transcriptional regulator [Caldilineaceae bacterium]
MGTVKNHVHHILDKLNVNSRQDAAPYLNLVQNHNAVVDIEPDETSNE